MGTVTQAKRRKRGSARGRDLDCAKPGFEVPPPPIAEAAIEETIVADVVVIGAGTAGLVTAAVAAEGGASVVVLAKSPSVSARGGSNFAIGSKLASPVTTWIAVLPSAT